MFYFRFRKHIIFIFLKDLFYEFDAGSQVHPKVNELPFNSFFLVLLLLQDKHVVVEKLLQFLIGEVDAELLQAVILDNAKYFENNNYLYLCSFL